MTEKWLLEDMTRLMAQRHRVVLLDTSGACSFTLPILKDAGYVVLQTNDTLTEPWRMEQEELFIRQTAETEHKNKPVVFYTTRPQKSLTFLFDYCFTHGCLNLSHPQDWLKKKIFTHTGLQVNLDNPMLMIAAKLGTNKDITWWKKIVQKLEDVINLDDELLPFVHDPEGFLAKKDTDIKRLFEEKLHELLQQPYQNKPATTLAEEVTRLMLDGLAYNECNPTLLRLYYKWADSAKYKNSLETRIRNYRLSSSANPWATHPDHCFESLDRMALKQIAANFRDKKFVAEKLQRLQPRIKSTKAKAFVPVWWEDIWVLFTTETEPLVQCRNLNQVIEYYTGTFSNADRAIRNLYVHFLNEEELIRPLQEYYEGINHLLLQTWFGYSAEYKTNQQGFLPQLLKKVRAKTAVIVGDGVRYEIADSVATKLQKQFLVDKQVMLADLPSETEHNMSALYVGGNEVLKKASDRELRLAQAVGRDIGFNQLEAVNYGTPIDYLVLTYKDIDSAGEKLQHAAVKLFAEFESVLIEKIALLLNSGYSEVYLITDHGFVLTGLLDEADKIDPNASGKKEVHERFLRTVDMQVNSDWIGFEKTYGEYNFVYVSKSHRPFISKGVYGFSHGGFTPQEVVVPNFKFSKTQAQTSKLVVKLTNKNELGDVPSELFVIKAEAAKASSDLFAAQRKVQLRLFAGNTLYQSSDIISVDAGGKLEKEFSFSGNQQINAVLIDAETQEQLDTVIVKKSNLRDLGGLL